MTDQGMVNWPAAAPQINHTVVAAVHQVKHRPSWTVFRHADWPLTCLDEIDIGFRLVLAHLVDLSGHLQQVGGFLVFSHEAVNQVSLGMELPNST